MPDPISPPRVPPSPMPVHRWTVLGCMIVALSGCLPLAIGGGVAAGGYAAGQERGLSGTASDSAIRLRINDLWTQANLDILATVDLTIFEGRVLLTGAVPNPDLRAQAVKLTWQADGVKEVIDEIQVAQKSTFSEAANDNWIQTRLRSQLVLDTDIRSLNYTLETVKGTVYVLGVARSQKEADAVLNYARNTPNVRRVVNYIRIRSGEPGGPPASDPQPVVTPAQNSPAQNSPAAAAVPPPSTGYATPGGPSGQAPIQVVPLK
ncbi:MAG TPA: BON domain-containing protein [Stellaceae bacterium]|nr:BON domain-containing protein [Stellaceae bacterium]